MWRAQNHPMNWIVEKLNDEESTSFGINGPALNIAYQKTERHSKLRKISTALKEWQPHLQNLALSNLSSDIRFDLLHQKHRDWRIFCRRIPEHGQ